MLLPIERMLLRQLFGDKQFAERVVPYLKDSYFHSAEAANLYRLYGKFYQKFHVPPAFVAVKIGLDAEKKLTEQEHKDAQQALVDVEQEKLLDESQALWAVGEAENFCKDGAIRYALGEAIKLLDDPTKSVNAIPELMKEALSVSFDAHIGHDYFADADDRWEFYHKAETRVPFDLETFNKMTKNGVPKKTLNIILAGTNVGKSLALVHFAAAYVRFGKNVLYITCEMAEEWISERIDANMMDIPIDDIESLSKVEFLRKINGLRQTTTAQVRVKEYPTASASVADFRNLLQDLWLKHQFKPDVIMVDYLTICSSERIKLNHQSVNSYSYGKFIAEELRGFATQMDVPVWTAAQFNREGFASTDPGLEHVGESFGIPQTADFCVAMVTTDELDKLGQIALFELKNRYSKRRSYQQHLLGIDTPRMKLYELSPQQVAASITLPTASPAGQQPSGASTFSGPRRRKPLQSLQQENKGST